MSPDLWWSRWGAMWYYVSWRELTRTCRYDTNDVLDLCAALLMRVSVLERQMQTFPFPFLGLF